MTPRRASEAVDRTHALAPREAAASHGVLGQFPQEPASSKSPTAGLHVDGSKQIVGKGDHDLGH